MDRMLYVSMSGASQAMLAQTVNNNNLANIKTPGFCADLISLEQFYVPGGQLPSRVYAVAQERSADFTKGTLMTTGRDLDIAVAQDGWIAVQSSDGKEVYTRAGDMHLTENGQLLAGNGYAVLGSGGTIGIPPADKITIGNDGTISILPQGQSGTKMTAIDQIKLVKIDSENLVKRSDGLFETRDGKAAETDPSLQVISGALENSNVNGVGALVDGIAINRLFEMQVKMMKTAEENADSLGQVLAV